MTDFFDKLRSDRKLDESLQLMHNIPNDVISSRLMAVIALHFAEVKLDHESIKYLLADDEKKRTAESSHCGAPEPQLRNHDGLTQPWQTDRVFAQKLEAVERSVGLVSPSDPDPDAALVAPPPLKSTQLG